MGLPFLVNYALTDKINMYLDTSPQALQRLLTDSCSLIAHLTCVIRRAQTDIVVDPIHTGRVILAVVIFTVIWVYFTPLSLIPKETRTALEKDKT